MRKNVHGFTLQNDLLFKKTFTSPGHEYIVTNFLRDVAGIPAAAVEFLPEEVYDLQRIADVVRENRVAMTRVDLLVKLEDGTQVTIEVQREKQKHFAERALFYLDRGYISSYGDGSADADKAESYASLRPIYGVNIVGFNYHKDSPVVKGAVTRYRLLEESGHQPFVSLATGKEQMMLCIFDLTKVDETSPESLQYWASAFINGTVPPEAPDYLKAVGDIIAFENLSEKERNLIMKINEGLADYYEGMKTARDEGEEKGVKKGRQAGRAEEKQTIALNLLKNGASIEFTAKVTDLTLKEVQILAETLK